MEAKKSEYGGEVNWQWADELQKIDSAGTKKPLVKRVFGIVLFFADEVIVLLVIAYILYRLFRA
jgi:hypothetical protein